MRTLLLLFCFSFIACVKCDRHSKNWHTHLGCVERKTFYDWNKVVNANTEEIFFGVGTEYYLKCNSARGQEELDVTFSKFYSNQRIIIKNDTIPECTNLLNSNISRQFFSFYKEEDAFYNYPQYLIKVDNKSNFFLADYVFYFEGKTLSGYYFKDSCIARIN